MLRKIIICAVLVLVGAAGGFGSATFISKSKLDKSNADIANLQSQLQKSTATIDENNRSSSARIMQLNMELSQVRTELDQAKAANTPVKAVLPENLSAVTLPVTADSASGMPTVEYIVKDGDSFWSIAQNQLGNGDRCKEISQLNPDAASSKYLNVGMKLKIPAK